MSEYEDQAKKMLASCTAEPSAVVWALLEVADAIRAHGEQTGKALAEVSEEMAKARHRKAALR